MLDGIDRRGVVVSEHGIGQGSESGSDRGLVSGLDLNMLGDETPDAAEPSRDESARAVFLVESERERAGSRGEGIALALVAVELVAQAFDLRLGVRDLGLRGLVRSIEVGLARIAERGLGFETGEFDLCFFASFPCGIERLLLPQNLAANRRET